MLPSAFFADFLDVPENDIFHDFVETVFRAKITVGCGSGNYCRNNAVTRAQMAVFLLKAVHGSAYAPPPCAGVFGDVVCPSPFADWIEQLASEGITGGCGGNNFCPGNPVTRAQMAVFLLKAEHGSSHVPPPCGGIFGDVACPSLFADWIEELYGEDDHRRLPGLAPALLPGQLEHARPDGRVPRQDVRARAVRAMSDNWRTSVGTAREKMMRTRLGLVTSVILSALVGGCQAPPLGPEFEVNSYTLGYQFWPVVDSDSAHNLVVVWTSRGQDGSGDGIFGRRFDRAGNPQGDEFQINAYTTGDQTAPDVAMDDAGNFVVMWHEDGTSESGIAARRFDRSGNPLEAEFPVTLHGGGVPRVAMNRAGDFVVVWSSHRQSDEGNGILGRRYDSAGTPVGGSRST